jgi:hypothetical protein
MPVPAYPQPSDDRLPQQPRNKSRWSSWNWLLVLPVLALCFPSLYARSTPTLLGWPFFYWYQFAWIILSGAITAVVYFATRDS